MKRVTIGSIVTVTLLLVGCGGGGSSSGNSTSSSLNDSTTPSNNETTNVTQNIGKGYYVDAAVKGVNYQCGNQSGTTDINGTFRFQIGSNCNFTVGGVKLRDINASLLENNITILETNVTVAQLLQTLDSDGNASNGIQIPKGADGVIKETLPSLDNLDRDLLTAIHDRLNSEHTDEYNGSVVDKNQTVAHLNGTRSNLEERRIRTNLDVEAEHRSRRNNNGTTTRNRGNENNRTSPTNSALNLDNNNSRRDIIGDRGNRGDRENRGDRNSNTLQGKS